MIVEIVMQSKPVSISANATIRETATCMRDENTRVLPVTEADHVIGVVTPWILTKEVLAQSDFTADTQVRKVMCTDSIWCKPQERLEDVASRMHEYAVMELPVIDDDKRPAGTIHYRDMTDFAREHTKPTAVSLL